MVGEDPPDKAIIDVSESVTSQSRHSLVLSGSPPHGKLLIPFERRDVRVVEGARLESEPCEPLEVTWSHLNAQRPSHLRSETYTPVCVGKPRYSSRF